MISWTILDKYVLSQTMRRLFIALSIVLLTLILERVLRLFEFAAANNAACWFSSADGS